MDRDSSNDLTQSRKSIEKLQNRDMIGVGLLGKQKSPTYSSKNSFALSNKHTVRQGNNDSRKNLHQREILSSAESSNHFITKTRVGGALKNTRQVVAPTNAVTKVN